MILEQIDNQICTVRDKKLIVLTTIDPQVIAISLQQRGYRAQVAIAVAHGALASPVETRILARQIGLLAPIDTTEARLKLLLK